ncbi:aminoglycoside phosphotransferase family protein [Cellulomonas sp. ATA003]|uniref:aminoglycoside phosphotransferase family protein n=1 Tax=Cellulomonas sp. ATA003 TaxID=3073064 RepID=UPI0028732419|nr:aminoglycoside phosphotransferase family protein [Cellulomonas sp. ATA003]WNB86834.1 aminoglycoside phosphotransferase family protein [Cellulomonas sp. ATA003]
MHIPDGLRRTAQHHPAGPGWLATLPAVHDRAVAGWDLTVGPPFTTGVAAWTAPARTGSGADVVLKLSLPDDEARDEAVALRLWDGRGAVRLLAHAADDWALLLERCRPGIALADDPAPDDERLQAGARVLRAVHAAAPVARAGATPAATPAGATPAGATSSADVRSMVTVCARGADVLLATAARAAGRPSDDGDRGPGGAASRGREPGNVVVDPGAVRAAAALLRDLPGTGCSGVVVHGDLNPGNVLRVTGTPPGTASWVAIDPKPLVGDPAHDPWPLLAQVGAPFDAADPVTTLRRRTALVAAEAGLDADRVVAWSFARSVQSAYWWVADGAWAQATAELARARVWGRLLGRT